MADSLPPGSRSRSSSSPPSQPARSDDQAQRRERRARKELQRKRQRRIDLAFLALVLLALGAMAFGIQGQQRKLDRAHQELAELRMQLGLPAASVAAGSEGPAGQRTAHLKFSPAADASPAGVDATLTLKGIEQAAVQALDCPKAASAQMDYRRQFLAPIDYWGRTRLSDLQARRVTYLFAGPDIATAAALFSRADHLVLVADQWVETWDATPPTVEQQQAECEVARYFARYGYFRTRHLEGLDTVKVRPRFLNLLLHNLQLADLRVEAAHYLAVGDDGEARAVAAAAGARQAGIRFYVRRPDGSRARIDYLRVDLSDAGLKQAPAQQRFLKQSVSDVVLLKSASHLLQTSAFSITADLVSRQSRALVQDETGLPIDTAREAFDLRLYGDFSDAHWRWSGKPAAQKLRKFQQEAGTVEPLFFTFGYEKDAGSVILVGTRRKATGAVAQRVL